MTANDDGGSDADDLTEAFHAFEERILDQIEVLLETHYESSQVRNLVYNRVFRPNEVLPKRDSRPKTTTAFVADQIHRAHGGDDDQRTRLLEFAVVVAEYADILDDVVDDDVAEGAESEALLVSQLLVPVLIRSIHHLGDRAVDYWTADASALVEVPLVREPAVTPSPETYLELLDEQATLRSSITGLAAVTADADSAAIARAERVGRSVHRLMQFSTDLYQYGWDTEPWNAVALFSEEEYVDAVEESKKRLDDAATYPEPYAGRITGIWDRDFRADYREAVADGS